MSMGLLELGIIDGAEESGATSTQQKSKAQSLTPGQRAVINRLHQREKESNVAKVIGATLIAGVGVALLVKAHK